MAKIIEAALIDDHGAQAKPCWKPIPHRLEPRCAQCLAWDKEKDCCEFGVTCMCECPMKARCLCEDYLSKELVGGEDRYREEKMRYSIGIDFGLARPCQADVKK